MRDRSCLWGIWALGLAIVTPASSVAGEEPLAAAASDPHAAHPPAETAAASQPADPDTIGISLIRKDASHPFHGVGDPNGFAANGVQGGEFVLQRGKTYRFEVKSNPMHDFYLTLNDQGWGAEVVDRGVTGNFIYEGTLTFTPDAETPDVVYYQCRNHKAMGGRLFIVDDVASADLAQLREKHGALSERVQRPAETNTSVSPEEVKKKLGYANMVAMAKPAKRIQASDNAPAKVLFSEAQQMIAAASEKHAAGADAEALAMLDEALRKMSAASQMVPSEERQGEVRQRYAQTRKSIDDMRRTHRETYERRVREEGQAAGVDYDATRVDALIRQADMLASQGAHADALKPAQEAERLVTAAVNKMLHARKLTYKLDLNTPEGEYRYEQGRYKGYAELVAVAIEERTPSEQQRKLLDDNVVKAQAMYQKAEEFAGSKDYPSAIRLVQDATGTLRRALQIVGVNQ